MHFTALGGLKGNWTDGALVEDLTVLLLNVGLLSLEGLKNHVTMETSKTGRCMRTHFSDAVFFLRPSSFAYSLVPSLARVVQTVFLDVLLQVGRTTWCTALRTAVRWLVSVDAFVGSETALVGQQHRAHVTHLIWGGKKGKTILRLNRQLFSFSDQSQQYNKSENSYYRELPKPDAANSSMSLTSYVQKLLKTHATLSKTCLKPHSVHNFQYVNNVLKCITGCFYQIQHPHFVKSFDRSLITCQVELMMPISKLKLLSLTFLEVDRVVQWVPLSPPESAWVFHLPK